MKPIIKTLMAILMIFILEAPCLAASIPDVVYDDLEAGYRAFREEDYEKAIEVYTKIIMNRDLPARDRAITYLLRGEAHKYKGDYEGAVDDFSRAIAIKPNYAQAFYFRGLTYENLGKYEDAYKDVRMAISFKPEMPEYQRKLAILEKKLPDDMQKEIAAARAEREKALKLQAEKEAREKAAAEAAAKEEKK